MPLQVPAASDVTTVTQFYADRLSAEAAASQTNAFLHVCNVCIHLYFAIKGTEKTVLTKPKHSTNYNVFLTFSRCINFQCALLANVIFYLQHIITSYCTQLL